MNLLIDHLTGEKGGLSDLQAKLLDLALKHPKIGIELTQVPRSFNMLQKELEERKSVTPFMKWSSYATLADSVGIP